MKPDFCLILRDVLFYAYTHQKGKQGKTLELERAIFEHLVKSFSFLPLISEPFHLNTLV